MVVGAPLSIKCNYEIKEAIQKRLDPPFEDLFDPAEESVLSVLFEAWIQILSSDNITFDKVCLITLLDLYYMFQENHFLWRQERAIELLT